MGDGAMFYGDETVGSFLIITDGFSLHLQLHPEAIMVGLRGRSHRHGRYPLQPAQSCEGVLQNLLLELNLQGRVDVLPVTTPALTKVRTRGIHSPGGRSQKVSHLSQRIGLFLFGDLNLCFLSFDGVRNEQDLAVHTGDPIALEGHGVDGDQSLTSHGLSVARHEGRIQCI
jgi:hypothetical protein